MNPLFKEAIPILEHLEYHGYEAYFVGGAVRDELLNRSISDIDIATSAPPEEVVKLFEKTVPVGIEHGTVLVRHKQKSFEVTTYRIESGYEDYRHPDKVDFVKDLHLDLSRRDFTINAMAMNKNGDIIDPFHGQSDLKSNTIKTVNEAAGRFQEDPLRMMRALRFVSQLGFSLEERTKEAIMEYGYLLEKIAVERLAIEMEKLWLGKHIQQAHQHLVHTDIYRFLPCFNKDHDLVHKSQLHVKTPFSSLSEAITCMHLFNESFTIDYWCKEWKLSNAVKKDSLQLLQAFQAYMQYKELRPDILYQLQPQLLQPFAHLTTILIGEHVISEADLQMQYDHLPIKSRNDLAINGNDILKLKPEERPGPWIQELIKSLESKVLFGTVKNNKEELQEWVRAWNRQEKG
ncbi:CCA tRNA nucleotidyltransferase [Salinibacillus xinjiangensis]|uniref:CCA-adding enzyme n=1 Tax=Salinibacillus xinjiangensis TaxID=1229268 RepID=A0A6G1X670_9BACI|nr:CCA tRNA nucleotidyltransferase [Salinibacillus xinjiangensis]MRG86380.1 CCA tRNA nucleotidyltransferase [Salinibacillus xinjiangensis]